MDSVFEAQMRRLPTVITSSERPPYVLKNPDFAVWTPTNSGFFASRQIGHGSAAFPGLCGAWQLCFLEDTQNLTTAVSNVSQMQSPLPVIYVYYLIPGQRLAIILVRCLSGTIMDN